LEKTTSGTPGKHATKGLSAKENLASGKRFYLLYSLLSPQENFLIYPFAEEYSAKKGLIIDLAAKLNK